MRSLSIIYFVFPCGLWVLSTALVINSYEVFELLDGPPYGWKQGPRAVPYTRLTFSLALTQPRADEFEQHVINIATPGHAHYGQHLTKHGIQEFLRPAKHTSKLVIDWLTRQGMTQDDIEQKRDWIRFTASIEQAERMLDTEFYEFGNSNVTIVRTLGYSIPVSLHHAIRLIQPTTRFVNIKPQLSTVLSAQDANVPPKPQRYNANVCNETITPVCLRGLYKVDNFTGNSFVGNKMGVSGYLDQYVRYSDLDLFVNQLAPYAKTSNLSVELLAEGLNEQNSTLDSTEANLDYALTLGAGTPVTYYSTGGRGPLLLDLDEPSPSENTNEPYLEQLTYLLDLPDDQLPTVLSTSYGENEQSVPRTYAQVVCNMFAQLGARGVSVIFASGDDGPGSSCQLSHLDNSTSTRFNAIFPASCPFVTSVGGTWKVQPESAVYFSGGGFSEYFARPAYQEDAVCRYLGRHLGTQWEGLYNPVGRGFPDVAAQSYNFVVYDRGQAKLVSGTSCAAPVFAAVIANLNSVRMTAGLPSLGFLNPFLYTYGVQEGGLTDITLGGSRGCDGFTRDNRPAVKIPYASWNATEGWDPVTGLGTPVLTKLVQSMFRHEVNQPVFNGSSNARG